MTPPPTSTADVLPVASGRATWRELWHASRGHRRTLSVVGVLGLGSAALGLLAPAVLGRLVDLIDTADAGIATVAATTAVMLVSSLSSVVGMALTMVLAARVYQTVLADLRERLVATALSAPQGVIERAGTGDLISRASDDVAQVSDAAPQVVPAITRAGFTIVVTFAGVTVLDWRYGAALAIVVPVYVLTLRWYLATAPRIYRAERAAMSHRAQHILESVRGFETVQGFDLTERRHQTVIDTSWAVVAHSLRARTAQNMFFGRLNLAEYLGMGAILIAGYLLIDAGHSTIGAATTAVLLFLRLFGPINQLLFVIDVVQSVLASLNRMIGVLTLPSMTDASPGEVASQPASSRHAVCLRGVSFSYGTARPALDTIDLTIDEGERVAVVGASGAGKTTLAGVIAGIHLPQAGTVTRPAETTVITQESHVFGGTLRDNLTLAVPDATDTALLAALHATGATPFLELLPNGLDTWLGPAGHALTAAQAQHVALARIVLADPKLAILDEATAEAGSAHADLLDHATDVALHGRTGLVIAHRLSQAQACDRIIVMHNGKIIQDGTHTELVADEGVYARLWQAWSRTSSPVDIENGAADRQHRPHPRGLRHR